MHDGLAVIRRAVGVAARAQLELAGRVTRLDVAKVHCYVGVPGYDLIRLGEQKMAAFTCQVVFGCGLFQVHGESHG